MFDSSYPFQYKRYSNITEESHPYQRHVYIFTGRKGHTYQVHLEEYSYELFALKFHVALDEEISEHKYEQLTHLYEVAPVLRTCLNILLSVRVERPLASFGFVGAPLPEETEKKNTKRYRLYRKIMANFFSPVHFNHFIHEDQSTYLLLNKMNDQVEGELLMKVEKMFSEIYSVG